MEISNGHNQEMELITHPSPSFPHNLHQEKKPKYQQNQVALISCPRCDSTNTKFCYYNNYSLSQPRYFCKACRRYWTKGGILRNVPVGGGCRKNKKSSSSSAASPNSSSSSFKHHKTSMTNPPSDIAIPNFPLPNDDLTLAFNPFLMDQNPKTLNPNPSFLDILRGGGVVGPAQQSGGGGDGFQSLCYDNGIGFGGGGNDQRGVLPATFHGGGDRTMMAPVMAVRNDDVGGNRNANAVGRDYWNDGGSIISSTSSSSTWQGLVNTSFL